MLKRNTIQRLMTYETVVEMANHPTADDVYNNIVKKITSISKATVYRNLNELLEMNKLLKIETPGGADHFDHQCHKHFHAKCLKCGSVYDVEINNNIEHILDKVHDEKGFRFMGYDLVFKGICPKCQSKNNKEEKHE